MIMDTSTMAKTPGIEDVSVTGASLKPEVGRITFVGMPCRPDAIAAIFDELAARRIMVDDIIQNVVESPAGPQPDGVPAGVGARIPSRTSDNAPERRATLSFTIEGHELGPALAVAELVAQRFPGVRLERDENLARVSVVGVGMRSQSGVAGAMFNALSAANIAIENISTSEIVISVLVRREAGERALQAVHAAFALDRAVG